jgi:hypothetical protein
MVQPPPSVVMSQYTRAGTWTLRTNDVVEDAQGGSRPRNCAQGHPTAAQGHPTAAVRTAPTVHREHTPQELRPWDVAGIPTGCRPNRQRWPLRRYRRGRDRHDLPPPGGAASEHTMVMHEVSTRRRNQCRETTGELERCEHHACGAIGPWTLEARVWVTRFICFHRGFTRSVRAANQYREPSTLSASQGVVRCGMGGVHPLVAAAGDGAPHSASPFRENCTR